MQLQTSKTTYNSCGMSFTSHVSLIWRAAPCCRSVLQAKVTQAFPPPKTCRVSSHCWEYGLGCKVSASGESRLPGCAANMLNSLWEGFSFHDAAPKQPAPPCELGGVWRTIRAPFDVCSFEPYTLQTLGTPTRRPMEGLPAALT